MKKSPALITFIAVYKKCNSIKIQSQDSVQDIMEFIREACDVCEVGLPITEEEYYYLASHYFLDHEAYKAYQEEEMADYNSIYG